MSSCNTKRSGGACRQSGLATVEFAIGTLMILLLMLISAEVGRVYYSYNTLAKAVRNGSRYLSTVALNSASVMDLSGAKLIRTRNLVIGGNFSGDGRPVLEGLTAEDIRISRAGSSESGGQYVQVSAAFDYRPMLGVISGFGVGDEHDLGFRMNATSVMRVLR